MTEGGLLSPEKNIIEDSCHELVHKSSVKEYPMHDFWALVGFYQRLSFHCCSALQPSFYLTYCAACDQISSHVFSIKNRLAIEC